MVVKRGGCEGIIEDGCQERGRCEGIVEDGCQERQM